MVPRRKYADKNTEAYSHTYIHTYVDVRRRRRRRRLPYTVSFLVHADNLQLYLSLMPWRLWLVPVLAAMEFMIFFSPIIEIHSFHHRKKPTRIPSPASPPYKYSAAALECALRNDIDRLEEFAATKDLTGENILFLRRVAGWKTKWRGEEASMGAAARRALFDEAEDIWARLVDRDTAEFPLNVEDGVYRSLEAVFVAPESPGRTRGTFSRRSQVVPFEDHHHHHCLSTMKAERVLGLSTEQRNIKAKRVLGLSTVTAGTLGAGIGGGGGGRVGILPGSFCREMFDRAEASVLQMVLENTWIRFVDSLVDGERPKVRAAAIPAGRKRRSAFWKKKRRGGCF